MQPDVLDAVDHLRAQLGLFYWTIRHGGDVTGAARQLQCVVQQTEQETTPWCLAIPQTLFARWSQLQLTRLLSEARTALTRMNYDVPPSECRRSKQANSSAWPDEYRQAVLYGPLV